MDWNESVSLYCSFPRILDGMYQSYIIHLFIDLTSKRKKGAKRGKGISYGCYRQKDRAMWDAL